MIGLKIIQKPACIYWIITQPLKPLCGGAEASLPALLFILLNADSIDTLKKNSGRHASRSTLESMPSAVD